MANKQELNAEDLDKIYVGQKFSSQKELFELLGLKWSSGHDRDCSKRTINRYMRLDIKKKNDITITEIYDEPLLRDDKRTEKEYEMNDEIENLLYLYLLSFPQSTITKRKLAYTLKCFSSDTYHLLSRTDESEVANEVGIDVSAIRLYKQELGNLCEKWIIERLKKFAAKGRINFYKVVAVGENNYDESSLEYKLYTEELDKLVEKWGYSDYGKVFLSGKFKKFHNELNEILDEYGLKGAYKAFRLEKMSFKPKKILDNMQNVETTVNEYFAYKLQSRIFNRIESKDKKIDDKFDEICNDGDEFKRAVLEDNARFYRKSQILGVFNYREDLKEQCNILINMTLNSNVKLFPECERKKREIEHFYQPPQMIKENANESKS